MALLVLIPQPEDTNPMQLSQIEVRESYSDKLAQSALQRISDRLTGQGQCRRNPISTPTLDEASRSALHSGLPSSIEPVLALLLLGAYESCQNGDRRQMRSRVYDALVLAMDLSLHVRDPIRPQGDPIKERVWWITVCQHQDPTIRNETDNFGLDVHGIPISHFYQICSLLADFIIG